MVNVGRRFLFIATMATLAVLPAAGLASESPASVGLGFEFTSGDYGTGTRTSALFVPLTIGINPTERLGVTLEIPYVYQNNTNVIAGQFGMQGQQMGAQSIVAAMGTPGFGSTMGSGSLRSTANSDPATAQGGLGDITLRAGYVLLAETELMPQFRPNLFVKFPTADKNKGLGTGEFDEGAALEVSKWFSDWYTFVEPGYAIQGKTPDLALKNYFSYNVGTGYQITDTFLPLIMLKGSTPRAQGAAALLEARLKLMYQFTRQVGVEGYLAKGLTASSPDFGTALAVYYDF